VPAAHRSGNGLPLILPVPLKLKQQPLICFLGCNWLGASLSVADPLHHPVQLIMALYEWESEAGLWVTLVFWVGFSLVPGESDANFPSSEYWWAGIMEQLCLDTTCDLWLRRFVETHTIMTQRVKKRARWKIQNKYVRYTLDICKDNVTDLQLSFNNALIYTQLNKEVHIKLYLCLCSPL